MLGQGQELAAIDFASIIGGPLQAVITAQAAAAQVTTQYIQNTAFTSSSSGGGTGGGGSTGAQQLKVVEFDYGQVLGSSSGGAGGSTGQDKLVIRVPLLTMLPIPFIRVESMTIDFNVSLTSTTTTNTTSTTNTTGSASGEYAFVNFNGSVTDQNTYQNGSLVNDTYSLGVTVNAVQDQMPGGMQSVLNIFNSVIQQQASIVQQVVNADVAAITKSMSGSSSSGSSSSSGG